MRAFWLLAYFGIAVAISLVGLILFFAEYSVDLKTQTDIFTVLAEGLGFIGLSLVEITIFLEVRKKQKLASPNYQLSTIKTT